MSALCLRPSEVESMLDRPTEPIRAQASDRAQSYHVQTKSYHCRENSK